MKPEDFGGWGEIVFGITATAALIIMIICAAILD